MRWKRIVELLKKKVMKYSHIADKAAWLENPAIRMVVWSKRIHQEGIAGEAQEADKRWLVYVIWRAKRVQARKSGKRLGPQQFHAYNEDLYR